MRDDIIDRLLRQVADINKQLKALQRLDVLSTSGDTVTNGDSHDHSGGDGAQIDHGGTGGLTDDDHTQYALLAGRSGGQRITGVASTGYALEVYRDLSAGSTDAPVLGVTQDNASDNQPALYVRQDGSGDVAQFYDGTHKLVAVGDDGKLYVILPTGNSVNMGLEITGQDGGYMRFRNATGGSDDFDPSMDAVGDTGSTIGFNFVARPYLDASGSIGMLISPRTAAGAALTAARLVEIRNFTTTVFGVETNGNVAIGSHTAQGKLHAHDGTGGFMFVTKTGINGTAQTIIPNGTGDVVRGATISGVYYNSNGDFGNASWAGLANGSSFTIDIGGGGTQVLTIAIAASGALTVQRTAGSYTWSVALHIVWL